jgi:hypothetical protein
MSLQMFVCSILTFQILTWPGMLAAQELSQPALGESAEPSVDVIDEAPLEQIKHIGRNKQSPSIMATYTLIDLGETDLPHAMLTCIQEGTSLGPKISNTGKIIANESKGGFVFRKNLERYAPRINGARIYLHSINDKENILVSIRRGPYSVEWFVWPTIEHWNVPRIPIETVEQEGYKIHLSTINDFDLVVGDAMPLEHPMPLVWTEPRGLFRVGHRSGIDLLGRVKSLNNNGTIVGKLSGKHEDFPFFWDGKSLTSLQSYRKQFCCPVDGKIQFEEVLVSNDNEMLGTFWINGRFFEEPHHSDEPYQAFSWSPKSQEVKLIDLDGMRFAAINSDKRIVGSISGKAAYCDAEQKPISLISALPQESIQDWVLIEATGINRQGHIVGYGTRGEKTHLFLATPL